MASKQPLVHAGLPHAMHMLEFMQHAADSISCLWITLSRSHYTYVIVYSKLLSPDKRYIRARVRVYETSQPAARKTKQFSGNLGKSLLKRCHRSCNLSEENGPVISSSAVITACDLNGCLLPGGLKTLNGSGFSFKQILWIVRCSDYSIILCLKKSVALLQNRPSLPVRNMKRQW
jgi:hypothetical protein